MKNTILLVDDEAGIRKVLGISLQDSGYDVHTAGNGQEALRLFKEIAPPIVLTDIFVEPPVPPWFWTWRE